MLSSRNIRRDEPLVPDFSSFEVAIFIVKLKLCIAA
jgi:hypothetical protein